MFPESKTFSPTALSLCSLCAVVFIYSVHSFICFCLEAIFGFRCNSTCTRRDRLQSLSSEISFQKSLLFFSKGLCFSVCKM